MRDQEILEKAIQKAIDGEWDVFGTECHQIDVENITSEMLLDEEHYHSDAPHSGLTVYIRRVGYYSPEELIFNHDFAKAIWGEEYRHWPYKDEVGGEEEVWTEKWKFHLQQMVIADKPIKYLGDNLPHSSPQDVSKKKAS